jgi:hypothetical protein
MPQTFLKGSYDAPDGIHYSADFGFDLTPTPRQARPNGEGNRLRSRSPTGERGDASYPNSTDKQS